MGEGLKADEARDATFPPGWSRNVGRKIGLPHCRPHDITRW